MICRKWIFVGAAVIVIAGTSALAGPVLDLLQPTAESATFGVLERAESEQDRLAQVRYGGDKTIDLSASRVIGRDARSGYIFLLATSGDEICLVVVKSADSSVGGCNSADEIPVRGLWVKYGEGSLGYLAVAVPDEFSDAVVHSDGPVLLREPNVVLVQADPLGQSTRIRLESPRFRDVNLSTGN